MRTCNQCGTEIKNEDAFCYRCGVHIGRDPAASEIPPRPVSPPPPPPPISTAPPPVPRELYAAPNFGYGRPARFRIHWIGPLAAALCVLDFFGWQCGSAMMKGKTLAQDGVKRFHQQMNAGDFAQIYADAGDGFRNSASQDELLKFLANIHKKMGDSVSEEFVSMQMNANTSGTFITVVYETKFKLGGASETFVWEKQDSKVVLVGYHIRSSNLTDADKLH